MSQIALSKNLKLPLGVITQTIAILARKGAGKSYTARRLVEQIHAAKQQVIIVDPKGDWWGIRANVDGKGAGLPIVIVGGERGDVPLEPAGGEIVARLCAEERASALLDLSLLRKHEVATFMTAFMEALYRIKAREQYRTPVMLIVDEADAIAPQKPQPNEARMLGAIDDIVRRGRQRGIGCTLVTQRSAVLNKNVLTQAQVLVLLQTVAPQDIKAIGEWVNVHGTEEQWHAILDSLPSLQQGHGWVWSPGWPTKDGILEKVHMLPIETFDSGKTPEPGEKRIEPKSFADVDLDAVKRQMGEVVERAKANDPAALKRRIVELENAAKKAAGASPTAANGATKTKTVTVEVPIFKEGHIKRIEALYEKFEDQRDRLAQTGQVLVIELGILKAVALKAKAPVSIPSFRVVGQQPAPPTMTRIQAPHQPRQSSGRHESTGESLPKGEAATLAALIQYEHGLRPEQLTVITGYKRSSRDAYLQRLREKGYVETFGDKRRATDSGRAAMPNYEPLPVGMALQQFHMARLPKGERDVLAVLLRAYPQPVPRERIDEATGYQRSSRDAYLQRLKGKELVVSSSDGVIASETLFDG